MPEPIRDQWTEWLLHRRHGGDPEQLQRTLAFLYPVRDQVLDSARVADGETVLDVGTGDGLIAFGALERVGAEGRVIFSDVSQDLLDHARDLAQRLDGFDRCHFVRAPAENLAPIADASVDVVTTRSVLIYVADKRRALTELFRVLRTDGRISLFEPINRFGYDQTKYDTTPIKEIAAKVSAVYKRLQPRETDPMVDFDERDLLIFAEEAGFREIHLELQVAIVPCEPQPWETALRSAGNPRVPTLAEAMLQALTLDEAERYAAHMRPLVEGGRGVERNAMAYLWAVKR